ncbi:hypothetical protein GTZ85_17865 [Streptomyces sp. SID5474]|nr:hypothetical protein [Streptomyces sp. SID5474]
MTPVKRERREKMRLRAAVWFAGSVSQAEVARRLGVSPQVVSTWHRGWVDGGADALRSAGPSGARRRVSHERSANVAAVLEAGPEAFGLADLDARAGPATAPGMYPPGGRRVHGSPVRGPLSRARPGPPRASVPTVNPVGTDASRVQVVRRAHDSYPSGLPRRRVRDRWPSVDPR